MIDFRLVEQYLPQFYVAIGVTLGISAVAILGSLAPGFFFALMSQSHRRAVRWLGETFIALGRNIPSIMQLFIVFYVLPLAFNITIPAFWAAALAFAFNGSGYVAAIVQTGLGGVPRGQWEAAKTLGIKGLRLYLKVIGPQALSLVVGPFMNELSRQMKSSSIGAAVAVPEIIYTSVRLSSETFDPLTIFTTAALLYIVIILPFGLLSRAGQRRSFRTRLA